MIAIKRYLIERRLFESGQKKRLAFRQSMYHKIEIYIRQISRLAQALKDNDIKEIKARQKYISNFGFKAPLTIDQCNNLIKDLREWREI